MSATQHDQGPDLHRMVDELVKDHKHREAYIVRGTITGLGRVAHHQTTVPALIDQLLEPEPGGTGEMSGAGAQSRPAARVEALDTITLIADEAGEWIDRLGGTIPAAVIDPGVKHYALRGSGAKRALVILRSLHSGLHGDDSCSRTHGQRIEVPVGLDMGLQMADDLELDSKDSLLGFDSKHSLLGDLEPDEQQPTKRQWCCTAHHVEHDVRYWWRQARIIAGWDSPPYRPFNTCPSCSQRKGLRINLAAHAAVCVECRTVWDPTTIGLLAEHIRLENGIDEDAEGVEAG